MDRPTLYLDCDETVLYSREPVKDSVGFSFYYPNGTREECFTSIRPGTKEFLEWAKGKYTIRMITQGLLEFQKAALKEVGILDYFDDFHGYYYGSGSTFIFSAKDPGPIEDMPEKWCLIDNDPNPWVKASWLGIHDWQGRLINCSPYYGGDHLANDLNESLSDYIPRIEQLLDNG